MSKPARRPSRRLPIVLGSVTVLLVASCVMAAVVWHHPVRGVGPVELAATKPWGVDFDIRFSKADREWQITNLVLHPPAPPPAAAKAPAMVMTKATFPYYELQAMNKATAKVNEKLADPDVDPFTQRSIGVRRCKQRRRARGGFRLCRGLPAWRVHQDGRPESSVVSSAAETNRALIGP